MKSPLDLLSDLPTTRVLVRASVLALGLATVGCSGDVVAPTCGPCCHDPEGHPECAPGSDAGMDAGADEPDAATSEPDAGADAGILVGPTCGPCCHMPETCDGGF
jgi:hypothetical protein